MGKGSNFSFYHSVFKSLVQQTRKNQGLFGKGLNLKNRYEHFQITDDGVKSIVKLFGSKSKLNSLNVSSNSIGNYSYSTYQDSILNAIGLTLSAP